ncbi:BrnA antitoxin family protein [Phenylobacterium sp.]|uniref:BrnA antitoxin family protein n=1 Tax=Phenylobacterium sp. TaxID=1871053 RepID=UPI00286D41B1|nr:BrnA antitoxin family protein [Phenylobacterium sp.]
MIDDENLEWTDEMFARARPAAEIMGAAFMEMARRPGRPKVVAPKEPVTLRFDAAVARHLRASGKGWQTRVNDALARLISEGAL